MRGERRLHLRVRVDQLEDDVRTHRVAHPGGRAGDKPFDVVLVRVDEEPDQGHLIVGLVGDIGQHQHPRLLHVWIVVSREPIDPIGGWRLCR